MTQNMELEPITFPESRLDYEIVEELEKSKVPIFMVQSKKDKHHYAMKVYPTQDGFPHKSYRNESKFKVLSHPNIISFVEIEDYVNIPYKGKNLDASFIVMELAPFGDFSTLLRLTNFSKDEKLIRSYFRQLINGIEYLHSRNVYHLDIKPDNLLLGEDFKLKIADFDSSYRGGESPIRSKGTRNYRAPEVKCVQTRNPPAADVYSAGICLFVMRTDCFAYIENETINGYDLAELMYEGTEEFWDAHKKILKDRANFGKEFKELFFGMVKYEPEERLTLDQVKRSAWFQGPVYSEKELAKKVTALLTEAGVL